MNNMIASPDAGEPTTPEPLSPERLAEIAERAKAGTGGRRPAQVAFAAAARDDVPALLADHARLRARVAELEGSGDPLPVRWDRMVIHPDADPADETIICCIAADGTGRPVALFLDDELREALGGQLLLPEGDGEVDDPRVAELEALAAIATEYRVPGSNGRWLWVRRNPEGDGWAVLEPVRSSVAVGRWALLSEGWRLRDGYGDDELFCWPTAEAAVTAGRRALAEGGERR